MTALGHMGHILALGDIRINRFPLLIKLVVYMAQNVASKDQNVDYGSKRCLYGSK